MYVIVYSSIALDLAAHLKNEKIHRETREGIVRIF